MVMFHSYGDVYQRDPEGNLPGMLQIGFWNQRLLCPRLADVKVHSACSFTISNTTAHSLPVIFCQPWMNKYEEQPHGGWLQGNQIYNSRYLLRVTPNPFQGWEIWWQNNNCDLFARETSYTHTYNISPSKSSKSSKWQQKQFYKSIETGWLQPIQGETGDLSPRNMANFSGSSIRPVSPEFLAPNPLITQKTLPPFILIIVGAMPSQDIAQIQLVDHGEPLGPPTPASDPFSAARWTRWTRWTCGSGGIKSFKFNASMVRNYKD